MIVLRGINFDTVALYDGTPAINGKQQVVEHESHVQVSDVTYDAKLNRLNIRQGIDLYILSVPLTGESICSLQLNKNHLTNTSTERIIRDVLVYVCHCATAYQIANYVASSLQPFLNYLINGGNSELTSVLTLSTI